MVEIWPTSEILGMDICAYRPAGGLGIDGY